MTEAEQPLIQIQELTKVFYTDEIETHALSGVHLSINKGEYVAMSGPSDRLHLPEFQPDWRSDRL